MASEIKVDTISEKTSANGVTIDGVLIKDSKLASGIGNVLQVVTATTTTDTGALAFTDTGLSGSITPSATSSKVLVVINQTLQAQRSGDNDMQGHINIMRDSTQVYENFYMVNEDSGDFGPAVKTVIFLDSPSTTSATTYKTQIKGNTSSSASVRANQQLSGNTESFSAIHLIEIGA
jgi:hypothetical protein